MSHALLDELWEKRSKAAADGKAILDTCLTDKREMSAEEDAAFERSHADMQRLDEQRAKIESAEKRTQAAEAAMEQYRGVSSEVKTTGDEFRSWLTGESRARSFELKPTAGQPDQMRDLVKGTTTAGGYTVPTSFYNQLVQHQIEVSGVLQAKPTIITTSTGENLQVPKTTAFGTAALVAEGDPIAESDAAFGQVTLGAYKYGKLLQISSELAKDSAFNLEGFIAQEAGRALGNAFGANLVTGGGSTLPSGVVTGSTLGKTGVTTGVSGMFLMDELIDLFYSVISPYRNSPSCAWLMRDATVARVRKLKDGQNNYLWVQSVVAGTPDTLLNKPVITDPNVAAVATSAKSVLFGDFSRYFVRQVSGVRFERSDDYAFANDLITYRALIRGDGALVDTTGAVKHFIGASS